MRLDPSALLSLAAASLTAGADRPFIAKTPQEVLFATLHAAMLLLEFSFCGLGEEGGIQTKSDLASPKPLPNEWNSNSESFALRYRHGKSALTFLLKGIKLGKKLGVYALTMEESKTQSLEFEIQDYICSHAKFPLVATTSSPSSSSSDHIHSALAAAFEGHDRISKLAQTFQQEIIYKLAPSLDDKSASPPLSTASSSTSSSNQQRDQGQVPRPPFFQPQQPPSSLIDPSFQPGYGNPYAIGDRDLDPFAAAPGIAGPRFPMYPPGFGPGGMVVGPDHPMFGGGGVGGPRIPSGGGQFLPPGAVPPGARFDPIGPFGGPSPYRPFAGRPPAGRGGGRGGGPFSGEPDNDELPPPGYTDMFG